MKINKSWADQLEEIVDEFLATKPLKIQEIDRYALPLTGGIYIFTDIDDNECVYVGQSGRLRNRVYDVHIQGKRGKSSFRQSLLGVKKTRINLTEFVHEQDLHEHISTSYLLRFLSVDDTFLRGCIESYLIAILQPKHSVPMLMK